MTLKINDKLVTLPDSMADFTLGRRLAFQVAHGDVLDQMAESINKMEAGVEKDLELLDFHFERMFRIFSFFTGIPLEACRESKEWVDRIAYIYNAHLAYLFEEPKKQTLIGRYEFDGRTWYLPEPLLKQGSTLSFGELIDSKQMIRDTFAAKQGKWQAVHKLAAIYLRPEGEIYEENFLFEGSARVKLMESLPMTIAHQVYFFLSRSMTFAPSISIFSGKARPKEPVPTPGGILIFMGGLTFSNPLRRLKFLIYREVA